MTAIGGHNNTCMHIVVLYILYHTISKGEKCGSATFAFGVTLIQTIDPPCREGYRVCPPLVRSHL